MKVNLISEFGTMNSFSIEQLEKQVSLICELNFVKTFFEVPKSTQSNKNIRISSSINQ
jgi:hypothetical protein